MAYVIVEKVVNMILGSDNAIWKNQLGGLTDGLVRKCNCEQVNKQRFEWHKWTKTLRKFRGRTSGADISLDSKEQLQHFEPLLLCLFICCPDVGQSRMVSTVSLFYSSSSHDLCWLQAVTENDKDSRFDFNHLFSTFPKNTEGIFPEFAIGLSVFVTWL